MSRANNMAIMQECPLCRRKQSNKNKKYVSCQQSLITTKGKKIAGIRYWITYRLDGYQIWKPVGFKLKDAQDLEGKWKSQKREKSYSKPHLVLTGHLRSSRHGIGKSIPLKSEVNTFDEAISLLKQSDGTFAIMECIFNWFSKLIESRLDAVVPVTTRLLFRL